MEIALRTYAMRDYLVAHREAQRLDMDLTLSGRLRGMQGIEHRHGTARARSGAVSVRRSSTRWALSASSAAPDVVPESTSPDAKEFRRHDRIRKPVPLNYSSVVIHHISDIHFGTFSSWPVPGQHEPDNYVAKAGTAFPRQYINFLQSSTRKPDFIVLTGDIGSIGADAELRQAEEFCKELLSYVATQEQDARHLRLIVVPGNHDRNWQAEDGDARLANFRNYFRAYQIPSAQSKPGTHRSIFVNEEHQLLFWAIDSTELGGTEDMQSRALRKDLEKQLVELVQGRNASSTPDNTIETIRELFKRMDRADPGFVTQKAVQAFEDEYKTLEKRYKEELSSFIKIAVLHHPVTLFPMQGVSRFPTTINGGDLKKRLQAKGFDLILHGHLHEPNISYEDVIVNETTLDGLHIIAAGTLAGHTGQHKNSFNRIELFRRSRDRFACQVDVIESSDQQFQESGRQLASFYRKDPNLSRLPVQFYDAIRTKPRIINVLDRELKRLIRRSSQSTGYDQSWLTEYARILQSTQRVYATDIQGMDVWTTPVVYQYFMLQAKRLLSERPKADRPPFAFSSPVAKAVIQALKNGDSNGMSDTDVSRCFLREQKIHDAGDHNLVEVVRILLWTREELIEDEAHEVIQLHEAVGIPLFFIDIAHLRGSRDETWNTLEYIIFPRVTMVHSETQGFWFRPTDPLQQHDDALIFGEIRDARNPSRQGTRPWYPSADFLELLSRKEILMASEARSIFARQLVQ